MMTNSCLEHSSKRSSKRLTVRVGILSLGCPKTLVDSETILGKLASRHYRFAPAITDCDVALINTCAFIQEAKEESIERILELIELKKEGRIKILIVMGCLVQRYVNELRKELAEVDGFIGSGDYEHFDRLVRKTLQGDKVVSVKTPGYIPGRGEKRIALTPLHYRYLKISEGCNHRCAFCTIPSFRGQHRSRPMKDIVEETRQLIREGAKEIVLTGQDTTHYGRDTQGRFLLPELLRKLDQLDGIEWLRLLYTYPTCLKSDLIEALQQSNHICHYLDVPLQHISDPILKSMRRGVTKEKIIELLTRYRTTIPDLAIRTTFIVGYPGETDKQFDELMDFMKVMRFERLGIFTYSREEGTAAAKIKNQIPDKIKKERFERAMLLQQEISEKNNRFWMGKTLKTLIDERDEKDPHQWLGRSYMDAPEVDGTVRVHSPTALKIGHFYNVRIRRTEAYDLMGEIQF